MAETLSERLRAADRLIPIFKDWDRVTVEAGAGEWTDSYDLTDDEKEILFKLIDAGAEAADAIERMQKALEHICDPVKLREAVMMTGAHLSQQQALDFVREDRLGARAALSSTNCTKG